MTRPADTSSRFCVLCAAGEHDPSVHELPPITLEFEHDDPACPACLGDGIVCENHPDKPWRPDRPDACCAGAGIPCPIGKAQRRELK